MSLRKIIPVLHLFGFLSCGKDVIDEKEGKPFSGEVSFTADVIARIDITTDEGVAVDSKDPAKYRPCSVKVSGSEEYALEARGKIRGRGNSTWNWYPKKPYRIKLDASASFLGMAPNKDWVLLADYRDVTHMMNLVGFYLAKELGLPYANHVRYATVTLNGEDLGLYMVTEQVKRAGTGSSWIRKRGSSWPWTSTTGPMTNPGPPTISGPRCLTWQPR